MLPVNSFTLNRVLKFAGLALLGVTLTGFASKHPSPVSMMKGQGTWEVHSLLTIGDYLPSRDSRFMDQGYQPAGAPDGLGAYRLDEGAVRILVNHELTGTAGYPYRLDNGTTLTGARISFLDVDRRTLRILNGGIAYGAIHDRQGRIRRNGLSNQ